MKRLLAKIRKKPAKTELPTRITNETVAEHRETILAGGRRFKYPLQYAKNKLVINTTLIIFAVLSLTSGLIWWQLYIVQNTGDLMYRITKVAPLPVGSVDDEPVKYSDYLLNYRPSEYYLNKYDEIEPNSEDGRLQLQYKKRDALDLAISDAYARKLAREHNLDVTKQELDEEIDASRVAENGKQSIESYEASVMRVLGTDREGTRRLIRNSLLRTKVAFAVDEPARQEVKKLKELVDRNKGDFQAAYEAIRKQYPADSVTIGESGKMSRSATYGGLRASQVANLTVGKISPILESVTEEGYYIVRLDFKDDKQIGFSYLHVPLTEYKASLTKLKEEGKVQEYITIDIDQTKEVKEEER